MHQSIRPFDPLKDVAIQGVLVVNAEAFDGLGGKNRLWAHDPRRIQTLDLMVSILILLKYIIA